VARRRERKVWSENVVIGEAELAVRFAAGEPGSVADVYGAYGRLVYTVAYRVLGDVSLAEDATQQTFVQAWQNASSFDAGRSLAPWLATIASRTAIDVYRRNRRHRDHTTIDTLTLTEPGLSSPPPSAEQIYDVWQVRRAVDMLPDHDRELIRLQHYLELTHTEIADRLAIPLGTVKSRSFRAHRRLAGLLGHLRAEPAAVGGGEDHRARTGRVSASRPEEGVS
jgi:RNA polymerase sigma factor (sigma-70 family)